MFHTIKLYFTNRPRFEERRRYMRLQREYRKKLRKLTKEFCPWSGYYMHAMIKTMLEFYEKTYSAGDCCWSEETRTHKIANQLKEALDYANKLEKIDDMNCSDMVPIAEEYGEEFEAYCAEVCAKLSSANYAEKHRGYIAYEFLEKKYTSELYNIIGKHIWEWCD